LKIYFKFYLKNEECRRCNQNGLKTKKKLFLYLFQHNESKDCFLVLCIASQRREQSNERVLQALANATDIFVKLNTGIIIYTVRLMTSAVF